MAKKTYTKLPDEVEAWKWDGIFPLEAPYNDHSHIQKVIENSTKYLVVTSSKSTVIARAGDYLIEDPIGFLVVDGAEFEKKHKVKA